MINMPMSNLPCVIKLTAKILFLQHNRQSTIMYWVEQPQCNSFAWAFSGFFDISEFTCVSNQKWFEWVDNTSKQKPRTPHVCPEPAFRSHLSALDFHLFCQRGSPPHCCYVIVEIRLSCESSRSNRVSHAGTHI